MKLTPEERAFVDEHRKWLGMNPGLDHGKFIAILSLLDRLKAAEANARTPGTVEVCQRCKEKPRRKCWLVDAALVDEPCPLRTKDTP